MKLFFCFTAGLLAAAGLSAAERVRAEGLEAERMRN